MGTGVVIRLRIQRSEPLTGTAVTEDGSTVSFEGWMELIGAVAELLGSTGHPCIGDRNVPGVWRGGG
jgi:hypothetical protein